MKGQKGRRKGFFRVELFVGAAENYYVMYTLCFLVFFLGVFGAFLLNGKSLVWGSDGIVQAYPGIVYTVRWLREFFYNLFSEGRLRGRMWDMTIGEGFNVLNVMSFRPLSLLALLFEKESMEWFFWLRTAVSLYIAGITFSCFCRLFKRLDYACLIGTLLYAFGGMTVGYYYRQPIFMEFIMYLPLFLYGAEKILRRDSGKAFVLSVALSGLSYFYILYILTIFAVMYAAVRYWFTVRSKTFAGLCIEIGRFAIYYAAGLGIAAVSLLPNLIMAFSSSRTGGENHAGLSLLYSFDYYDSLVPAILEMQSVGVYGFIGFTVPTVLLILILLGGNKIKDRRTIQLRFMIIAGVIMMLFPIFSLFMNGGGGITQRWFFAAMFGASLIVAFEFERAWFESELTKKELWILTGFLLLFLWSADWERDKLNYLLLFFLYLSVYFQWKESKRSIVAKRIYQGLFLGILLVEISCKAYDYYTLDGESSFALFPKVGTVFARNNDVTAVAMNCVHDSDIYRVDAVEWSNDEWYTNKNYGARIGVNGLSSFYSYIGREFANALHDLGVSRQVTGFDFSSYDQRTVLDELSAVKYVTVADDMQAYVPYGYEKVCDNGKLSVYRNQYSLPLIYAYPTVITGDDYEKLPANLKEQAMLQGAVIEGNENNTNLPMRYMVFDAETLLDKEEILAQIQEQTENDILSENGIMCNELSRFEFQFSHPVTGEIYMLYEGLSFEGKHGQEYGWTNAALKSKEAWKRAYAPTKSFQYYKGAQDVLLNLGYVEEDSAGIMINFVGGGTYCFDNISIIVQPMDHYAERVDALRIPVENLSIDYNQITADIALEEPRMVCIAIPYDKGWSAKVDGKAVDLQLVSGRYLGIELGEGNHHLELHYVIPGIVAGACISVGTIVILIVCAVLKQYRKRRNRRYE